MPFGGLLDKAKKAAIEAGVGEVAEMAGELAGDVVGDLAEEVGLDEDFVEDLQEKVQEKVEEEVAARGEEVNEGIVRRLFH